MNVSFLLKGLLIGFAIAAPVGPIGVLCIQRTLSYGRLSGLFTGLGAATADGIYGAVAAFGLTFISDALIGQQFWIRLLGGLFLLYLAMKISLAPLGRRRPETERRGLWSDFASTLFLTITNPMTILSFVAVFAGLGLAETGGGSVAATILVAGVFCGSAVWWLILSGGVARVRTRVDDTWMRRVNLVAGLIVAVFAVSALVSAAALYP
jgi:threonine/homoserine/homoserine lactone efflux protein